MRRQSEDRMIVFQENVARFLFEKCMTQYEHIRDLSKMGLKCLFTYFKFVNSSSGKLRLNNNNDDGVDAEVLSSDVNTLDGWSLLWNVALNARDENVANFAIRFVVEEIAPKTNNVTLSKFWTDCTKVCVKYLKSARLEKDKTLTSRRVRRCMIALQLLLRNSAKESKGRLKSHELSCLHSEGGGGSIIRLRIRNNVKESPTKGDITKEIEIFETQTVSELCEEVASCVKVPVSRLRIFACGRELKSSSHTVHSVNIRSGNSILVVGRRVEESKQKQPESEARKIDLKFLPGTILCEDENLFVTLFDLLDSSQCSKMTSSIWTLLMTLPSNSKLLKGLNSLQDLSSLRNAMGGGMSLSYLFLSYSHLNPSISKQNKKVRPYFERCMHFKS